MYGSKLSGSDGYGGILGSLAEHAPRTGFDRSPDGPIPSQPAGFSLAALTDLPVRPSSPYDFDRDFQNQYILRKLWFEPTPLPANPFYWFTADPANLGRLFEPLLMSPPGGVPMLPPRFR